jgi:hypothetical protein
LFDVQVTFKNTHPWLLVLLKKPIEFSFFIPNILGFYLDLFLAQVETNVFFLGLQLQFTEES